MKEPSRILGGDGSEAQCTSIESTLITSSLRVPWTVPVTSFFGFLERSALFSLPFRASAAFVFPPSSSFSTFPAVLRANPVVESAGAQDSAVYWYSLVASTNFLDHGPANASPEQT